MNLLPALRPPLMPADGVPALMAYDAEVEIRSKQSSRQTLLADFYSGYKQMDLKPGELITSVNLPAAPSGRYEYYRKVGTRRYQAISKVVLAGWITLDDDTISDVRLVLGSVGPYTMRIRKTEDALRGKTLSSDLTTRSAEMVRSEISPIDDVRSTGDYRRIVAGNLLQDFLQKLSKSNS